MFSFTAADQDARLGMELLIGVPLDRAGNTKRFVVYPAGSPEVLFLT